MAKWIMRVFGALALAIGIAHIVGEFWPGPFDRERWSATTVPYAALWFLIGAALLGFARVIALLERIDRNTADSRREALAPTAGAEPR